MREEKIAGRDLGKGRFSHVLATTRGGRFAQLGAAVTIAAVSLLIGILIASQPEYGAARLGFALAPPRPREGVEEIRFVLPLSSATTVFVAGDFNGWEPTALSDEEGDGIWTGRMLVPPGRYEYAFIIDGRWWGHDPLADDVVSSFGEYNSVRYVVAKNGA